MKRKNLSDLDTNGYYNQTIHKCILKLHLPLQLINDIYKNLYNENEVSGVFYVDNNDKVIGVDKNEGDEGSVYTPNNVINYHTHPINAYRNGKTSYGCPSGEDYRETLKFALNGNKAHLVFTVEGLYTIQVSPCKIKKMKELLNDVERGILIFLIEEYFKSNHDFRCVDELNELNGRKIHINPYSFVDFANTFDITNVLVNKQTTFKKPKDIPIYKTGHTGIHSDKNIQQYSGLDKNHSFSKIPNMGFPVVTDDYITTKTLKNYLTTDDLENLRRINQFGDEDSLNDKTINDLVEKLKIISKDFNSAPCKIEWNSNPNAWFFVNFFPTQHYINNHHRKENGEFIMPKKDAEGLFLTHEPFIRIFSNNKSGCKITKIAKTHNFNMNKKFSFGGSLHRKSTFGKSKQTLFIKKRTLSSLNSDIHYLLI